VVQLGDKYQVLLDRAIESEEINHCEKYIRFLAIRRDRIHRIHRQSDTIDVESKTVILEVVPEDQRAIDEDTEKLCQVLQKEKRTDTWRSRGNPAVFKLKAGVSLNQCKERLIEFLDLDDVKPSALRIWKEVKKEFFSTGSLGSDMIVVKEDELPYDVYGSFEGNPMIVEVPKHGYEGNGRDRVLKIRG
jgi:hypothetical protein